MDPKPSRPSVTASQPGSAPEFAPDPPVAGLSEAGAGEPEVHVFLGMPAIIQSVPMRRLLEFVERVGRSSAAVLISGESGTGKELIARAIHDYSLRSGRPWIDLNCAALPELLIESELFGYERGAFTGAMSSKPGMFELANSGSVFLDEIGEMPPRMQVKLLRVLDGAPYYRLGGTRKISVDVRVIAASNQDLEAAIGAGTFRRDLYHRLAQVRVHVPPLRERLPDIAALAHFFLARQERQPLRLSDEALAVMKNYDWPGNVRELRNAVVQAAIMADDGTIEVKHLPFLIRTAPAATKPLTLEGMEREMILRVMTEMDGAQQRTADSLGISLRTLGRKLKQYQGVAGPSSTF